MENKVRVKKIIFWLSPIYGNIHTMPYGKLVVTDGETTKVCYTKGDTLDTYHIHNCQYITFKRKAYKVCGTVRQPGKFDIWLEPIKC